MEGLAAVRRVAVVALAGAASTTVVGCGSSSTSTNTGKPTASLLRILGVLRSPATRVSPSVIPPDIARHHPNLYVNYVRRARSAYGDTYYVYVADAAPQPHSSLSDAKRPVGLCLLVVRSGNGGSDSGPITADQIEDGGGLVSSFGSSTRAVVDAIVPDAVATVSISYRAGPASGFSKRILPAVTITARPVNNVLVASVPRGAGSGALRPVIVWHAANGAIIRTIRRP